MYSLSIIIIRCQYKTINTEYNDAIVNNMTLYLDKILYILYLFKNQKLKKTTKIASYNISTQFVFVDSF